MNFQYLKAIEISPIEKEGFFIKNVDFVIGYFDENGRNYLRDNSYFQLSFPKAVNNYTYEDYKEDFNLRLKTLGHVSSENIILALTHIFVTVRNKSLSTERAWSDFTNTMFAKCKMHLEFPTKIHAGASLETIHLKNYDIGKFDTLTVKSKIKKHTISDYWDRYIKHDSNNERIYSENLSFRRLEENITIINAGKLWFSKYYPNIDEKRIFDLYFNALTEEWFKIFWKELDDRLIESAAMGGAYYPPKLFLELSGVDGVQLGIYTHIGNHPKNGWVTPFVNKVLEISFDSQLKIPLLNAKLESLYKKLDLPGSDYLQLVKLMIHFIGNGTKLLQEDRVEEAFINLWISLDTVLNNDTEAKSNQLKNRVAALTWHQYHSNQSDQYDFINFFYRKRSAYIHSGVGIDRKDALSLNQITQTILHVLLNMHASSIKTNPMKYEEWLRNIDALIELGYKGEDLSKEHLESIGIIQHHK